MHEELRYSLLPLNFWMMLLRCISAVRRLMKNCWSNGLCWPLRGQDDFEVPENARKVWQTPTF
jgi:hypothetical protein